MVLIFLFVINVTFFEWDILVDLSYGESSPSPIGWSIADDSDMIGADLGIPKI